MHSTAEQWNEEKLLGVHSTEEQWNEEKLLGLHSIAEQWNEEKGRAPGEERLSRA